MDNRDRLRGASPPFLHGASAVPFVSVRANDALRAARALRVFGLAAAIAFGMSLQFLAQLFVWQNWPVGEVLRGWLYIFRDRLVVACLITLLIVVIDSLRSRSALLRSARLAAGILSGALAGEWVVRALYGQPSQIAPLLTSALRWAAVACAVATTYYLWQGHAESARKLREERIRGQLVEQQLTNTRLTALSKHIEPHFLFNTLATVRRLHQTDPSAGAGMLAGFIDYLRRIPPMLERSQVPLVDEISLVRAYLAVVQVRMPGLLEVHFDVPDELLTVTIPPLALATLVENAVKHGVAPMPSGGTIRVSAVSNHGRLELAVTDNGVGLQQGSGGGTGIGLYNVRARLATLYGASAELSVQSNRPTGVSATITMPLGGGFA